MGDYDYDYAYEPNPPETPNLRTAEPPNPLPLKTLAIYAIDQDPRTTTTLGVYRFTQILIAGLAARREDPGFRVRLWVSDANAADFVPTTLPPWMDVRCVPGTHGTGWRRLWADHVRVPELILRDHVQVVHFPKGWIPLIRVPGCRTIAWLHDTITQHYMRGGQPNRRASLKWRYFDWMMRHAARRADRVITSTHVNARNLTALVPGVASRLSVVPCGGVEDRPRPTAPRSEALLVPGSRIPHKATRETLELLNAYAQQRGQRLRVIVTVLESLADLPGLAAPAALDLQFAGRVPQAELERLMQTSRALLYLSEVEGFGMPLLESYSFYTPVCYRDASSMQELMQGAPGGWDGRGAESFARALDAVLAMTPADVERVRASLMKRYDFRESVTRTLEVYASALGMGGAR